VGSWQRSHPVLEINKRYKHIAVPSFILSSAPNFDHFGTKLGTPAGVIPPPITNFPARSFGRDADLQSFTSTPSVVARHREWRTLCPRP
jgi:long-subunit fatty acid transport protein